MAKKFLLSLIIIVLFSIFLVMGYYIYLLTNENKNLNNKLIALSNSSNSIQKDTNNSNPGTNNENTLTNNQINSENIIVDSSSLPSYNGYCIKSGYINNMDNDKILIKTLFELEDFIVKYNKYLYDGSGNQTSGILDGLLKKYNNNYFSNQSLAIKYVSLTTGDATVDFIDAIKNSNDIVINFRINTPQGISTDDMSGYLIVVEVGKDITEIL